MSTISWSAEFSAINCYRDIMEPCNYTINITFDDEALTPEDQATAFGRIRHLIKDLYQDAIFIWLGHPLLPTLHKKLNTKLVTLPFAPNNYCVGTTTWYKILSITQGRVSLTNIDLSADKSDNICIHIDQDMVTEDELMAELAMKNWNKPAWWFRPTPTTFDVLYKKKDQTYMDYHEAEWAEWLQWEQQPDVKVVKKKTENNVIPLKKDWKPEVIKGDKN